LCECQKIPTHIPRSWRHIKEDYLHHFSLPRLDLLAWILITKLAPSYYRKLDVMLNDIGRFRELPKWRKEFKSEWKKAMKTQITMPLNEKYRPDPKRFICTCPQFVISRFLICKHLVQLFHPVDPVFFLEVTRNRSTPFWSHPALKPIMNSEDVVEVDDLASGGENRASGNLYNWQNTAQDDLEGVDIESDDGSLVDTREGKSDDNTKTCKEEMMAHIQLIRDFCDGLEYQLQFQDLRFLKALEKEGAGFFRLAQNCLSRERRLNSSRAASPKTWENSTANALFYRSRPRPRPLTDI
jgi:hypothetical protein